MDTCGAAEEAEDVPSTMMMMRAAARGEACDVEALLLQKGGVALADACHGPEARTVLMEAAAAGHGPIVRMLLDAGADLDRCDAEGRSALYHAAKRGQEEVVAVLLQRGANAALPNRYG